MVSLPIVNFQLPIELLLSELRTSAIGNRKSAMLLALRKLEAFACTLLSVLLSFLDAWIARYETGVFEGRAQVSIILEQRAGDAVPNRTGLTCGAAAGDVDHQIKLARRFRQLQWLADDHAQCFVGEIALKRLAIYLDFAGDGAQINPGRRRFASPGSVILNFCHS